MKIENQVPLKATCLKLQAIGFEFDSYFSWSEHYGIWHVERYYSWNTNHIKSPMVPELLDKIPTGIIIGNEECALEIHCHGEYCVWFNDDINFDHPNLAEALAQMLIWVKEKSYI